MDSAAWNSRPLIGKIKPKKNVGYVIKFSIKISKLESSFICFIIRPFFIYLKIEIEIAAKLLQNAYNLIF